MPTIVTLPHRLNVETMYDVIGRAIDEHQKARGQDITFDFSGLSFVDPDGMTVLSNLLEWLKKREVRIALANCDIGQPAIQYMDDCGFFGLYGNGALRTSAATRETTIPFRRLLVEESHEWLDLHVFPWLAEKLQVTTASLAEFKTCVREIFNNIEDHSTERIGCAHIQWFQNEHKIKISISDFGVGIPTEIRRTYQVSDDAEAIALAIREGISSKRNGRNRGAGLSYLIDNVVRRNGGSVSIHSNRGQLTCWPSATGITQHPQASPGFYPETLVSIELRTDRIERVEEQRESLEW